MDWLLILAIIGILGTLVFGITTIVVTRRKKEPVWAYKTINIVELGTNVPSELKLTYNGKAVKDVYRTTLILFNRGKEPIRENDKTEPVTIYFMGGEILNEPIIKATSNEAIAFSAKRGVKNNEHFVELNFLHLDHDDGAVMEIMHTSAKQMSCKANIIGAKNKEVDYIGEFEDSFPKFLGIRSISFLVAGILAISLVTASVFGKLPFSEFVIELIMLSSVVFGIFFTAFLMNYIPQFIRSRKFPDWTRNITKTKIPVGLSDSTLAYCVKCRGKKEMKDPSIITLKDGRSAIRGICPDCGTKMFRIPHS